MDTPIVPARPETTPHNPIQQARKSIALRRSPVDQVKRDLDTTLYLHTAMRFDRHMRAATKAFRDLQMLYPEIDQNSLPTRLEGLRCEGLFSALESFAWTQNELSSLHYERAERILDNLEFGATTAQDEGSAGAA